MDTRGHLTSALLVGLMVACETSIWAEDGGASMGATQGKPEITLDYEYFPRGEERALRLVARRPEVGLAFKFHCFEVGPFHEGTAEKRPDGSVVFTYRAGELKCVTTFTPLAGGRIAMDLEVSGPVEELKKIRFIDGCLQYWESPAFRRRGPLVEFAERAFIYTMRGPVSLLDTPRGKQKSFAPDSQWNTPPCTQWYVPIGVQHPGDIWSFGTCGDRPIHGLIGVVSRDGKWLSAMGRRHYNLNIGQGWHDCLHCGGHTRWYLDEAAGVIRQRTMLYLMPNDKEALLRAFLSDFPERGPAKEAPVENQGLSEPRPGSRLGTPVSVEPQGEVLLVKPQAAEAPTLELRLTAGRSTARAWKRTYWGTFSAQGNNRQVWAHPQGNAVELCVSVSAEATEPGQPLVQALLGGDGWTEVEPPEGVPAKVLRSKEGGWSAGLFWERSLPEAPSRGVGELQEPAARTVSVRGRLVLYQGEPAALADQWTWARTDWAHAVPYRMPAPGSPPSLPGEWVTFAPKRRSGEGSPLTYGLTILPPWKDAGYLHVNLPEHLEYDDQDPTNDYAGYGILRHSDKTAPPWHISPDGRTAYYRVESPHLPGVIVEVRLTGQAHQAVIWMKVTNNSRKTLPRIKPLLCFQYRWLRGFPGDLDENFNYSYVMVEGKAVRLADLSTERPAAQAVVAYVKGCSQHDCDKFARSRGGLAAEQVDAAVAAVTSKDGRRKVILGFAPGKSILSNALIPCLHADPLLGDLAPGESVEVSGVVIFTEGDLKPLMQETAGLEWLRGAGR